MGILEQQFLDAYDPSRYERPSVAVDMAVLTLTKEGQLGALLVRRGGHPFKGKWALPGGFLRAGEESAEEAARRELEAETGVTGVALNQLATFSDPERDPRTHVVSIVYTALAPKGSLKVTAGDDAAEATLFTVARDSSVGIRLKSDLYEVGLDGLAFDHGKILKTALDRLAGRVKYLPDAFLLLQDKHAFTAYELKQAYEAILGETLEPSNFRKAFLRDYVGAGLVREKEGKKKEPGRKPAALYDFLPEWDDMV